MISYHMGHLAHLFLGLLNLVIEFCRAELSPYVFLPFKLISVP